jgi:LDH2 family malate/lactate/ureidoglycolate dehydrogenase
MAIAKCRGNGVAAVGVRNSHHFGAAGHYARMAAEAGVVGIATSSSRYVSVVPTRGAEPILGTNPIAIGAPAAANPPVVLDMATSVAAINKVRMHALRGEPIPAGWVVDGSGESLVDATLALDQIRERPDGGLTPLGGVDERTGGHKGYGLALFAQILGGTLTGSSFSPVRNARVGPNAPDDIGHMFIALDPSWFRDPGAFESDVDAIVDTLHGSRPADPDRPVLVAGDPERATREERLRLGIPLPGTLCTAIRELADAAGSPFLLR